MTWEEIIETRAAEAHEEIKRMAERAQSEIAFRFSFIARSNGQLRRYARQRQQQEK